MIRTKAEVSYWEKSWKKQQKSVQVEERPAQIVGDHLGTWN